MRQSGPLSMNRFVYICPGGIVMFDRSKNSMLRPLPGVNQSRKYLRTFLCHRISFCPFSSSSFLAKKAMYKSLSLPSGVDSALRSCVTKREKWLEIHITVPSTINKLRIWYHVFCFFVCFLQTTRTSYDRNCRQPEARIGNVARPEILLDTNLITRKNIVIRDF